LTSVRTVDPHWGERLNSSADFNPNHNASPKQASLQTNSRPHYHATPKKITEYKKCTRLSQKEMALATKCLNKRKEHNTCSNNNILGFFLTSMPRARIWIFQRFLKQIGLAFVFLSPNPQAGLDFHQDVCMF
jgi:hypothetical protein